MSLRRLGLALGASLVFVSVVAAQSAEADFHHAYFLERERGHLEEALTLYREVAASTAASSALRQEASERAQGVREDLAAVDLARLMPVGAIAYAELVQPGEALTRVLEQLGLGAPFEEAARKGTFTLSPELVHGLIGIRAAAVALTRLPQGDEGPGGVLVLHTGEQAALRGLIESLVLVQGIPGASLGSTPTWSLANGIELALTQRLVVVASERAELEGVLARLAGEGGTSLADAPELAPAFAKRQRDPFFVCVNAAPLRPFLAARLANGDPRLALAASLLDPEHLECVFARVALGEEGLLFEGELLLDGEHRNLAFNFLRPAPLDPVTLELVPRGAAAFLATAFNERGPAPAPLHTNSAGVPAVSALDLPRELFANVAGLALYVLPGGGALPEAALVLSSNDPVRTEAVLGLALGLANQFATGRGLDGEEDEIAGAPARIYRIPPGLPLYVARSGNQLVLSPSEDLIERALNDRASAQSILRDEAFAAELGRLDMDTTLAVCAHLGRLAEVAQPYLGEGERQQLAQVAPALANTVLGLRTSHGDARLALALSLQHLPRVESLVAGLLAARRAAEIAALTGEPALLAEGGKPRVVTPR
jgi:hypothetical protein